MNSRNNRIGVISQGIKTPIIKPRDDLLEIVISSVVEANGGKFDNGDIIGITEAVLAISQENFVTHQNIVDDITKKFNNPKELVIVDPIQSRNRFMDVLKAIVSTPSLEKIYIIMTYPTDEVGNRFISDMDMIMHGVNPFEDVFSVESFYSTFGEPKHPFTGKNYIQEYIKASQGKAEVILCNNFRTLPEITNYCENYLVCSIHRRNETRTSIESNCFAGNNIYDLSEIMNKSIDGSGYNEEFGLYGTNLMSGDRLKLMPRDSQTFVEEVKAEIEARYNKQVEVFVYGDGAFKDPVGGIWELADPCTTLGATEGLKGTPKEVKLKYIASANECKTSKEIETLVAAEIAKRKATTEIAGEASLGTTPRQITDLLASLADLTTGSGDRQTPVVYIKNYF